MSKLNVTYEPIVLVIISLDGYTVRVASRDYYYSDAYYKGSLLNFPRIIETMPDISMGGAEYNQSVTLEIANEPSSGSIDDNWYEIANTYELREKWVNIYLYDENDGLSIPYTGKITSYEIRTDRILLYCDMRHDIVAELFFVAGGPFKVYIVKVCGHLVYLSLFYVQAKLLLCLCKFDPEPSPGAELFLGTEKLGHFSGSISFNKGACI